MFVTFVSIRPLNASSAAVARATSFSIAVLFDAMFVALVAMSVLFCATWLSKTLIAPAKVSSSPAIEPVKAFLTASVFADSIPNVLSTHCCFSAKIAPASALV